MMNLKKIKDIEALMQRIDYLTKSNVLAKLEITVIIHYHYYFFIVY